MIPRRAVSPILVASLSTVLLATLASGIAAGTAPVTAPVSSPGRQAATDTLEGDFLYRALMLRAAPGDLLAVIDMVKDRLPTYAAFSDAGPFLMRHSQGDQWDLMVLFPMGGFEEYYSPAAVEARESAFRGSGVPEADFESELTAHVAWREDWFVRGPAPGALGARFDGMSFFHIEIFLALHDKRGELLEQRRMENDYLERIGRQQNVIFTRAAGAPWDMFTLGFYRDIKQYAESADIAEEVEERAARAAGFEGAGSIGSYLRSLIAAHHDTLAVAVR